MGVYLEGALVDTLTTAVGQTVRRTWSAAVADGQLTVVLDDLGGSHPNVVLAGLAIRRVDASLRRRIVAP
jgi:hypothetical protein